MRELLTIAIAVCLAAGAASTGPFDLTVAAGPDDAREVTALHRNFIEPVKVIIHQ